MKLVYLKSALKCNSIYVATGIKLPIFRVLVTIEPGRCLLQFVTTNFENDITCTQRAKEIHDRICNEVIRCIKGVAFRQYC